MLLNKSSKEQKDADEFLGFKFNDAQMNSTFFLNKNFNSENLKNQKLI